MEQKVIKIGNSFGITLPRHFVKGRKLKAGQIIYVNADPDSDMLIIRTSHKAIANITPEFTAWLGEFTKKHEDDLKELAKY